MNQSLIDQTVEALKKNHFNVFCVDSPEQAKAVFLSDILPTIEPGVVSYGDSLTLLSTGILDEMKNRDGWSFLDTFEPGVARDEILERRRQALLADLFFTGSNALTTQGQLVNLDMIGNRVGGIVWGPRKVVLTIGTNKIVETLDDAMSRVRVVAPKNAARHKLKTPCVKTGTCMDCKSPGRICNVWTITEKSWPPARISVLLMDGEHGL